MTIHRTVFQHSFRIGLGILAAFVPLIWPLFFPFTIVALCSVLAYDGLNQRIIVWCTVLLILLELVAGIDLGMLSLPFLLTAMVLGVGGRIFSLTPWAASEGWHIGDLVRTAILAAVLTAVMTAGSVLVGTLVYRYGVTIARLTMALSPRVLVAVLISACAAVIVLRRIDTPFRHRIRFGM